jgi:hypothetical protein
MMRKLLFAALGLILAACLSQAGQAAVSHQVYFPGDVVHIVVEAPVNTDSVSAVMPDGQELNMIFDRRNQVWHNYWQVPMSFKKGTYTAKLSALDVEGKSFEGESAPILVDEPTIPVIMRFTSSGEVRPAPAAVAPVPAAPAPVAVRAKAKPREKRIVAQPKEDFNVARIRYITSARDFVAKQEYEKAVIQLQALLKIDPGNKEVKLMLARIESIIKARKTLQ